jgi:exoribonuclease-2
MSGTALRVGSLVLYKGRPARVKRIGAKVQIELEDRGTLSVRPKDVTCLHSGPMESLSELEPQIGEVKTAWEILTGETISLLDLAELVYGTYTPATAWAAWELVADGLFFTGSPEEVTARDPEEVSQEQAERETKTAERKAWAGFIGRARAGQFELQDRAYLGEVESLALGKSERSRVLRELGRAERPETAHALLLELGFWDRTVNPYPQRLGLETELPGVTLPDLPEEPRVDLTHLAAFAIDDEGNQDPDDAVSLEGDRLWVHIADVAALVPPGSEADQEASARGANLYLPEGTVPMLPQEATPALGLGLTEVSPALSFGLDLDAAGEVTDLEVVPSWVRVTRLTYVEVETLLEEEPFQSLYRVSRANAARRRKNGAIFIELPEVKIVVQDSTVEIKPLPALKSRDLVTEAMLMTGEAVARFAVAQDLPFPFSAQESPSPEPTELPTSLAGMYALRRTLRRSQMTSAPTPHAGLGLDVYAQVTSPLRRYLDLVAHQQLRAHLRGEELLDPQELLERVGAADAVTGSVRQAEWLSRQHWTLIYLLDHPEWIGEGVLVDRYGSRGTVLIPELDFELRIAVREDLPLDSTIPLVVTGVDLPELEAYFRIAG